MLTDMYMTRRTNLWTTRLTDGHQFQKQSRPGGVSQPFSQCLRVRFHKAYYGQMHAHPKWANGQTQISKAE